LKHHPLPPVSFSTHSFQLDDEIVLFSEQTRRLFRLNNTAAFIWRGCEEGLEQDDIIDALSETFDLSRQSVKNDVDSILSEWTRQGFLGADTVFGSDQPDTDIEPSPTDLPQPLTRTDNYPLEGYYQLPGTGFRFRYASASLADIARSVLGHLEVPEIQNIDITVDVYQDASGFYLLRENGITRYCTGEDELAPLLHGFVLSSTYSATKCLLAIHAAAVSNGETCLVFPALPGSGKSTLAAALIASGYGYCTDELVLLQAQTHHVQAIAMAPAIKAGSWEVLKTYYPGIENLPVYTRPDTQKVRYLQPEKHQLPRDMAQQYQVQALLFPAYQAGAQPALTPVSPADALCRMTDAGTDIKGGLDLSHVTDIIDWIGGIDSYELRYSDLDDAITHVRTLLP